VADWHTPTAARVDWTECPLALRHIVILIAAVWMSAATMVASDASELLAVDIRLRIDPSITPRQIVDGLKSEAEAVWRPYGIRIRWWDAAVPGAPASALILEATQNGVSGDRGPVPSAASW
jgi:hypothetical protein